MGEGEKGRWREVERIREWKPKKGEWKPEKEVKTDRVEVPIYFYFSLKWFLALCLSYPSKRSIFKSPNCRIFKFSFSVLPFPFSLLPFPVPCFAPSHPPHAPSQICLISFPKQIDVGYLFAMKLFILLRHSF